ncbi:hypothetical protein R5H30_09030 [Sulfitobacter sp. D35]|uniref:hypothetical protein n=1 Tax=Sulfitobacter sp. D35 TaxID=3083252 RepID=UPI00296EF599|nr:hypothetical protein [Sulfitobacter sp. D35]MDW4498120.1 hypothetical protein [Sulfitobacter sp. D35]
MRNSRGDAPQESDDPSGGDGRGSGAPRKPAAEQGRRNQGDKPPAKRKQQQMEVARPKAQRRNQQRDAALGNVPRPARPARTRRRHVSTVLSFFLLVVLPVATVWWYLNNRAADQYVSHVAFSVQREESSSAMEILGGLTALSSGSSSDPDILYEYIQSQELVRRIDERLDLRALYSKPEQDVYFAYDTSGTIEDLTEYWQSMTKIYYDSTAGTIELLVLAFDPDDAQQIAQAIYDESSLMINELSSIAREDATRYAREELEKAVERLKDARLAITAFRNEHQIVDPNADIQGQISLVTTLQEQLAAALIELDLLEQTSQSNDPRLEQVNRKIEVINDRISEERNKFGALNVRDSQAYSTIIGEYESLTVDREFAEQAYLAALSTFDTAQAEAQRKSRYLAAYVKPTRAERSTYPEWDTILIVTTLFALLSWATIVLLSYALRDRR